MSFLIYPPHRSIVMHLPQPEQVLSAIPSARVVEYNGNRLVAVPHNVWETQMLRRMGHAIPSPIGYYYDWPRQKGQIPNPFNHQIETSAFLTLHHRAFCLNDMGTGKTMSALWAADYLIRTRMVRKVLIISPLSTLDRVWSDAIFEHFRERSIAVLHGTAEKRKRLFANNAYDFYVVNHDALDIICDLEHKDIRDKSTGRVIGRKIISAKFKRDDIDLVIIDEVATYRNASTKKFKTIKRALKPNMWCWGLTGTPTPNEPADAWAQCNLLMPKSVPEFFTTFKQFTMQQLTEYVWVPKKEATELVFKVMQPAIRYDRDECLDLPECTFSSRSVEFTAAQKKHYREVMTELSTEINGGRINAVNEGVKAGKLLQIACGEVYDSNGVAQGVDAGPRIEVVKEIIEQSTHKVIVFVPFTAPLVMLARKLEEAYPGQIATVNGNVSQGERNRIFAEFQRLHNPRVLVADAGTMSHGLTLTEANTIVWYAPEWSNDTYNQANARISRPGQKNQQHIIHISGSEIERKIYARLRDRSKMQGVLLDAVASFTRAGVM
jgi:SNF2 family DNA or RNA helicase